MFIHWGLYAIPRRVNGNMNDKKGAGGGRSTASSWSSSTPAALRPCRWAKAARDGAGMKVHGAHSAASRRVRSVGQRGFVRPLRRHACGGEKGTSSLLPMSRPRGTRACAWGCITRRWTGDFPATSITRVCRENAALMKKQTWGQVEELLKNYGQIDVLWYDGDRGWG